jgi:putative salt-induced outer membrane protein YdiY
MRRSFFCVILLLVSATLAVGDQVTLKNGDRLTGMIVSGDGKTLLLKTEFAGDVTITWDAITSIESARNLNLTLKDGSRLAGKVTTLDGKFVVAGTATPPGGASAPKDVIVALRDDAAQKAFDAQTEKMAHPKFTYFWGGLFDTGLAVTQGNSSTETFTLSAKAVRETPRDKITLYSTYIYGNDSSSSPSRTTANALTAGIRGDYNIKPTFFAFATADFETNALQHLDLRTVFGGGFGYHAIKTARSTFDVFGGLTYDRDSFGTYTLTNPTPPPPLTTIAAIEMNSAEAVVGEEFDSKLNKRTTLTERFSVFPNLSHTGEYRFQFDSTVATQLKNWLSWHITFNDHHISYPPPGLLGNDILLSMGLRVTWGKAKL